MITLALPKGRLSKTLAPLLNEMGLGLDLAYFQDEDRRLIYKTADPALQVVPVKPFDVATLVATGGAALGIVGADVVSEFDYCELYVPIAFSFGACRLSIAGPAHFTLPPAGQSIKVATKYPRLTKKFFQARGLNPTLIPLSGALELAPHLGLADCIVDLVSTGATLKANHLVECECLMHSTARLIVDRQAYQTAGANLHTLIDNFRSAAAKF